VSAWGSRVQPNVYAGWDEDAIARSGKKTRNVVDHPGVSTMSTNPSWASATDLAIASPRPVPGTPISVDDAKR
jgi:hypothetical protein